MAHAMTTMTGAQAGQAQTTTEGLVSTTRLPLLGLLATQAFIGYEWFVSGLTKIVRGGFPAGLADELTEKSVGAPGWYASILNNLIIPNGRIFGYLSELGELLTGIVLIGAAAVWFFGLERLRKAGQITTLALILGALLVAIFLNVNFHLANGSSHPWFIPKSGFDEGVDLDSLMPLIEGALAVVTAGLIWSTIRKPTTTEP